MRNSAYSTVDEQGNVIYDGPLAAMKGDHSGMPRRTEAYLPGFERGHVTASSLGGLNTEANVVPQHYDLNHGAYYSMEAGQRDVLKGGSIHSHKEVPADHSAFMVTDHVTYADGHTEQVHLSFANASYAEQEQWANACAEVDMDDPNPGDIGRASMTTEEYAQLMEETDACLPGVREEYEATVTTDEALTAEAEEE